MVRLMHKKYNYKSIRKLNFIIPLIIAIGVFSVITYFTVQNRMKEHYTVMESESISLARSYSFSLANSKEAETMINRVLEDKLAVAAGHFYDHQTVSSNNQLEAHLDLLQVDAIYYYNSEGEILYSHNGEFIGWNTYESHPVHTFLNSELNQYVGPIRQDTEKQIDYKYGYFRLENGDFVQIGILADTITTFLAQFELDYLINEIQTNPYVDRLYMLDNDLLITHSTNQNDIGQSATHILGVDEASTLSLSEGGLESIRQEKVFHVFLPIFYQGEKVGTLAIERNIESLEATEYAIIRNGVMILTLIIIALGTAFWLIYKRNQSFLRAAYYDGLTKLPNLTYLKTYLEEILPKDASVNRALFLINIRNFKTLNLTYGYKYGDLTLKYVSERLRDVLGQAGVLFKFNEDRFVFLVEEVEKSDKLIEFAHHIEAIFEAPFMFENDNQYLTSNISIIEFNYQDSTDSILRNASIALDFNKSSDNHYTFFSNTMTNQLEKDHAIELALTEAIQQEDEKVLTIALQPLMDTKTLKIQGFESLARLQSLTYGNIEPNTFIRVAEEKFLIAPLGRFLMKQSLEFLREIDKKTNTNHLTLSINVSVLELLRGDYVSFVQTITNHYHIHPKRIELEVTESVFADKFDLVNGRLGELRKHGFKIAIDDFGTGYSSFSRLKELNVDTLKIDKYFTDRIKGTKEDFIIEDIINLAHKLNLKVVTEGVETASQVEVLKDLNSDFIQGFYFSQPLAPEKAMAFTKHYGHKN